MVRHISLIDQNSNPGLLILKSLIKQVKKKYINSQEAQAALQEVAEYAEEIRVQGKAGMY